MHISCFLEDQMGEVEIAHRKVQTHHRNRTEEAAYPAVKYVDESFPTG